MKKLVVTTNVDYTYFADSEMALKLLKEKAGELQFCEWSGWESGTPTISAITDDAGFCNQDCYSNDPQFKGVVNPVAGIDVYCF